MNIKMTQVDIHVQNIKKYLDVALCNKLEIMHKECNKQDFNVVWTQKLYTGN